MTTLSNNNTNVSNRVFVETLEPKVKKIDNDDHLDLFCYTSCDENEPDYIRECRGLVFEGSKLIVKTFPYGYEYTYKDYDTLAENYGDLSQYTIFPSYEGTLIRVFYHNNKWYTSTHRRLDAFRSKWASKKSYGLHFIEALEYEYSTNPQFKSKFNNPPTRRNILEQFYKTLDKTYQYTFLLQNSIHNSIVCRDVVNPRVFHVGTFINGRVSFEVDIGVSRPSPLSFDTLDKLIDYVEELDIGKLQGVIMYSGEKYIKILNHRYKYYFGLRGNEPSLKFRYLQVRNDDGLRNEYITMYEDHIADFQVYEDTIHELIKHIFNAYLNRFIHKKHVVLPVEEYQVLKECHSWHVSDRSNNHISIGKVSEIFNNQTPSKINRMIRRFLNNQRDQKLEGELQNHVPKQVNVFKNEL